MTHNPFRLIFNATQNPRLSRGSNIYLEPLRGCFIFGAAWDEFSSDLLNVEAEPPKETQLEVSPAMSLPALEFL